MLAIPSLFFTMWLGVITGDKIHKLNVFGGTM